MLEKKIGIVFAFIMLCSSSVFAQNPCDNPRADSCLVPDTCCSVAWNQCPWQMPGSIDIVFMVNLFKGNMHPQTIYSKFDVNCDCRLNGIDILYLVNYFRGRGPAPKCCFYECH
jgi:hypothetical protein